MKRRFSPVAPPGACVLLLVWLICWGCAQVGAPSGGPEDREAPRVLGMTPDSGSVGVRPETLSVLFSKGMDRSAVRDWIFISPPLEVREARWQGNRVDILLRDRPDTGRTYAVLFGSEVTDRRQIPFGPWSAAFSTGSKLDDGVVEGRVLGGRLKTAGAYLFAWPWEDSFPPTGGTGAPPLRIGQAGKDGSFRMGYLPRNLPMRLCALYDAGHDRDYDAEDDVYGCMDEPLVIDDTTRARTGIKIYVVLPDEPGSLKGTAADSSCVGRGVGVLQRLRHEADSLAARIGVKPVAKEAGPGDSLLGFAALPGGPVDTLAVRARLSAIDSLRSFARADSARCAKPVIVRLFERDTSMVAESRGEGSFEFREVAAGIYRIRGFRDENANGLPDPGEAAGEFRTPIELKPGRNLTDLDFVLRPLP